MLTRHCSRGPMQHRRKGKTELRQGVVTHVTTERGPSNMHAPRKLGPFLAQPLQSGRSKRQPVDDQAPAALIWRKTQCNCTSARPFGAAPLQFPI